MNKTNTNKTMTVNEVIEMLKGFDPNSTITIKGITTDFEETSWMEVKEPDQDEPVEVWVIE